MYEIIQSGRNENTGGQNAAFSCGNPKEYFYADLSFAFDVQENEDKRPN